MVWFGCAIAPPHARRGRQRVMWRSKGWTKAISMVSMTTTNAKE
jgi:hypothetical protein